MQISLFSLLPGHGVDADADLHEVGLRRAALADELGFHCFWVAEHHIRSVSCIPNPAVFLAAASQRTRRIRLGTAVAVLSVRHPLLVAEEYAQVDRLSGGRLNFGAGSGTSPIELAGVGIELDKKRARFAETLSLVRRAWTGEGGPVAGEFHDVGDLTCNVEPLQSPTPPIWVAVGSDEAARDVGVIGDGALLLLSPDFPNFHRVQELVDAYREGLQHGGHDESRSRVSAAVFSSVAQESSNAITQAAASFERLLGAQGVSVAGDAVVTAMTERGTSFVGTPEFVAEKVQALADCGVDETLFCLDFGGASETEIEVSMRLIAESTMQAQASIQ